MPIAVGSDSNEQNLKHLIHSLGVRLVLYYKSCDVFLPNLQ